MKLLSDQDAAVKFAAAGALGRIANPLSVAPLIKKIIDCEISETRVLKLELAKQGVKFGIGLRQGMPLDCTPQVRHDNFCDRHFEDDLWQQEGRTVSFRRLTN